MTIPKPRAVIFIIAAVIFLVPILLSSLALADYPDVQKEPIPKGFIRINLPSGVSPIDLRGTGKADDWAIVGSGNPGMLTPIGFDFLTKDENDPIQKYHSVNMPRDSETLNGDISHCTERFISFLRDAKNPKQVYMSVTSRSEYMSPDIAVKFKINLYRLTTENPVFGPPLKDHTIKPSDDAWYVFYPIKNISVPTKHPFRPQCVDHPEICEDKTAACTNEQFEQLEEKILNVKVKG